MNLDLTTIQSLLATLAFAAILVGLHLVTDASANSNAAGEREEIEQ